MPERGQSRCSYQPEQPNNSRTRVQVPGLQKLQIQARARFRKAPSTRERSRGLRLKLSGSREARIGLGEIALPGQLSRLERNRDQTIHQRALYRRRNQPAPNLKHQSC